MKTSETDNKDYTYTREEHVRALENDAKVSNLLSILGAIGFVAFNVFAMWLIDWFRK
jgi:hypothetical protein